MKRYVFAMYLFALTLVAVVGMTPAAMAASAEGQKETVIRITAGDKVLFATLGDTKTAQDFIATLPRTLPMQRLFDREYYALLPAAPSRDSKTQETHELGDVAFWTKGDCFGLLFSFERPKLPPPIIAMGKVTTDLAVFDTLGGAVDMVLDTEK